MKLSPGFAVRAAAIVKNAPRPFKTPTMAFPVSEGMSDAPTSTDLAAPGRLAAAKNQEGFGMLRLNNLLLFPNLVTAKLAKEQIKERAADTQNERLMDATIQLEEKSVGTITFDTSKGSTVVQ